MKQASPFKHLLLLSILLATSLPAFSQHFEWVRTYTGSDMSSGEADNKIIGSCVDSLGNLYILGEFSPQAQLCGVRLLPFEVIETSYPRWQGTVIAKVSPAGELLWHKSIYNGKQGCFAYALRMMDDSCIMAMVSMGLPYDRGYNERMNLYYLDTLLTGNSDYLMPTDSVISGGYNAFITFDFDGNVTEQHLVCVGYTDSLENALTSRFVWGPSRDDKLSARILSNESFNIDSDGNIYVIRSTIDVFNGPYDPSTQTTQMWRIDEGSIGALKIVVDGNHYLTYPIPHPTALWNQQILKFSPHFDSLIGAVYMFDSTLAYPIWPEFTVYSFEMDAQNNMYINMEAFRLPAILRIANSNSLLLSDTVGLRPTWLLKYNSNLEPMGKAQLSYTTSGTATDYPKLLLMNPHIDNSTNSLFISGAAGWVPQAVTVDHIFYNEDTLDFPNYTSYWLRLDMDDLRLLSYGVTRPGEDGKGMAQYLAAHNNRVHSQFKFLNSLMWGDSTIIAHNADEIVYATWDYSGREIGLHARLNVSAIANILRAPIAIDSIVYLTGSLWEDATFGDITTHNQGYSQVYIAKYVDPEFARPYMHPSDREEQTIEWPQTLAFALNDSPVTLTATATSGLPVSYSCSDSTIAYLDGDQLHLLREGYAWLTATQEGDDYHLPAEPVQRLLTVGAVGIATVGADGQAKAYPNPTSGRVTIDLAKIPPAPPLPYHRPRPSDTSDVDMVLYTSPGTPFSQYECCDYPYHQRYNMKVSGTKLQSHDGVVTAWLTDMQGRREEVVLTPTGPDRYTLDLTNRPPAAYLLTVTTADGRELTFRLMKQYGRR